MKLRLSAIVSLLFMVVFAVPVIAADISCRDAVEVCPPSPDPCGCVAASPLGVTGPVDADVGSDYDPVGGRANYLFSITQGTINSEIGTITAVPECIPGAPRGATITVTDACGQVSSMEVRLPGGEWTQTVWRRINYPYTNKGNTIISGNTKTYWEATNYTAFRYNAYSDTPTSHPTCAEAYDGTTGYYQTCSWIDGSPIGYMGAKSECETTYMTSNGNVYLTCYKIIAETIYEWRCK